MISVPPTGSMQTVTVTAAVPPARIIVVDDNLKIKSIASNTKEDVNPKVVLNNIDGKEIYYSESIDRQYDLLKLSLNFSKPGVVYQKEDQAAGAIGKVFKTIARLF